MSVIETYIAELDPADREQTVASASGGTSSAGSVTLNPGDYVVFCSEGGHRQAGMEFAGTAG